MDYKDQLYHSMSFSDKIIKEEKSRLKSMADYDRSNIADILNRVDKKRVFNAIDVGCGPGYITNLMSDIFDQANILGIDREERYVSIARNEFQTNKNNLEFIVYDCNDLTKLQDKPFDVVLIRYLLEYIKNPELFLEQVYEITHDDGIIIIMDWDIKYNIYIPKPRYLDKFIGAGESFKSNSGYDNDILKVKEILNRYKGKLEILTYSECLNEENKNFFFKNHEWYGDDIHPYVKYGYMNQQELDLFYKDLQKIINANSMIIYNKVVLLLKKER